MLSVKTIIDVAENKKVFRKTDPTKLSSNSIDKVVEILFPECQSIVIENNYPAFDYVWMSRLSMDKLSITYNFRHIRRMENLAKHVLDSLRIKHPIDIRYTVNKGPVYIYYKEDNNRKDWISLPHPNRFQKPKFYYKTLFHEATHAACAKTRLDIRLREDDEEILAEFVSMVLCLLNGCNLWTNSLSYMISWSYDNVKDKLQLTLTNQKQWDVIEKHSKDILKFLLLRV